VQRLDFGETGVAGQAAQHPNAQFVQQRQHVPELAGDIELANQADIVPVFRGEWGVLRPGRRFPLTNHLFHHHLARQPVAEILAAVKPGGVDSDHRHAHRCRCGATHRLNVVALHRRHAGVVDKDRRRVITADDMPHRVEQPPFAAPHDHVLLVEVGGETESVERRAGTLAAAVIPGTTGAANRPVYQMGDIRQRQQRDLRAVKRAAARGGAGFRRAAPRLLLVVMFTGRLVEQRQNLTSLHLTLAAFVNITRTVQNAGQR